ncbi:unnamed protein product [Chondrus crispus]|uniref:Uncharacterized protein n=1 Tax=Chondrus crispus TaxID=2769 RepID=R7QPW7_CHOCR|nr:unnamed protein product [Chondrus crispus]CDF39828.1 unnamed protein product [Chondrus crispus]|eukprot:XP_005710122.1 unnamed protein product [Chondrus crispus]
MSSARRTSWSRAACVRAARREEGTRWRRLRPRREGRRRRRRTAVSQEFIITRTGRMLSAKGKYIITKTGTKFHVSPTCYRLGKARSLSYAICPPDELEPCRLCARGAARGRDALAPAETAAGGEEEEEKDSVSQEFIITRTGRMFHADRHCYNLRRATKKIPVTDVPMRLVPCPKCTDGKRPGARHARIREEEEKEEAEERKEVGKKLVPSKTSSALKACERMFFKTTKGDKVHVDRDCRHLKNREVLVCDPVVEEKEPCRTCSLALFQELEVSQWCHFCEDMTHIGSLHVVSLFAIYKAADIKKVVAGGMILIVRL